MPELQQTAQIKRLRMRSWRRGTKEMDMILGPFSDGALGKLDADDLARYEALLQENDQDLYQWFSGQVAAPAQHLPMIAKVQAYLNI